MITSFFIFLFLLLLLLVLLGGIGGDKAVDPVDSEVLRNILQEIIVLEEIFELLLLLLSGLGGCASWGWRLTRSALGSSFLSSFIDGHHKGSLQDGFLVFHTFFLLHSCHVGILSLCNWLLLGLAWGFCLSWLRGLSWSLPISFLLERDTKGHS